MHRWLVAGVVRLSVVARQAVVHVAAQRAGRLRRLRVVLRGPRAGRAATDGRLSTVGVGARPRRRHARPADHRTSATLLQVTRPYPTLP